MSSYCRIPWKPEGRFYFVVAFLFLFFSFSLFDGNRELNDFENISLAAVCMQWLGRRIDRSYREMLFKYLGQGEIKT